jgi:hypothetical protein
MAITNVWLTTHNSDGSTKSSSPTYFESNDIIRGHFSADVADAAILGYHWELVRNAETSESVVVVEGWTNRYDTLGDELLTDISPYYGWQLGTGNTLGDTLDIQVTVYYVKAESVYLQGGQKLIDNPIYKNTGQPPSGKNLYLYNANYDNSMGYDDYSKSLYLWNWKNIVDAGINGSYGSWGDWGVYTFSGESYSYSTGKLPFAEYQIGGSLSLLLAEAESTYGTTDNDFRDIFFGDSTAPITWATNFDKQNYSSTIVDIISDPDELTAFKATNTAATAGWLYYYKLPVEADPDSITVQFYQIDPVGSGALAMTVEKIVAGNMSCADDDHGNKCYGPFTLVEGSAKDKISGTGAETSEGHYNFNSATTEGYQWSASYTANGTFVRFSEGQSSGGASHYSGQSEMASDWIAQWSGATWDGTSSPADGGAYQGSGIVITYSTKDL